MEMFHASRHGLLTQLMEYIYISHVSEKSDPPSQLEIKTNALEVKAQGGDIKLEPRTKVTCKQGQLVSQMVTHTASSPPTPPHRGRADYSSRAVLFTFTGAHGCLPLSIGPLSIS